MPKRETSKVLSKLMDVYAEKRDELDLEDEEGDEDEDAVKEYNKLDSIVDQFNDLIDAIEEHEDGNY